MNEKTKEEKTYETDKHFTGEVVQDVLDVTSLGGGLQMVSEKKVPFTKAQAERILNFKEFIGDRGLRNKHVEYLIQSMKRGTFRYELVKLIVCEFGGETFRMNGQHVSWARISIDEKMPDNHVSLATYRAKTEQDMRILYSSIDRNAPRTKSNVIYSYLAGTEEFGNFSEWVIQQLSAGFAFWKWPSSGGRWAHDGDDVAYLLQTEYLDLSTSIGAFLQKTGYESFRHMKRSPVVAAMFATFSKAKSDSDVFWKGVVDGVGMTSAHDPRLKLRNELQRQRLVYGKSREIKSIAPEGMFASCIHAWNAFRSKEDLKVLRGDIKGKRPTVK